MGSFVFKWEHPASEVYVTGTFDSWGKSEKLEKVGDIFVKDVTLSSADEKIYYKFVVDGNWVINDSAPQEADASGNLNNVLTTDRIVKHTPATAGIMSGVGPNSTTAGLAGKAPLEHTGSSDLPGAFPETPAATEKGDFSVNPLPATDGASNPIKLGPGEKVPPPSDFTSNTVTSGVHDDPELVAADKAKAGGSYDATPTIQSTGPQSTTAQLAGAVPLESSKVPEVVKESQAEAGVGPEASAIPEEVKEKSSVEKELLAEVPTVPATSEGTGGKAIADKSEKGVTANEAAAAIGGAAVALGGAATAYASGAASKLPDSVTSKLPVSIQNSINNINAQSTGTAKDTPEVVKESIAESGQAPEAAANEEAVLEKKAVEKELLSEIKPETSSGEPAPKISEGLAAPATPTKPIESREVSPGTVPGSHTENQTAPIVTSGIATTTVDKTSAAPATPAKSTAGNSKVDSPVSSSAAADKKKKRTSIFGKLKAKFSDKKKE